MANLEYENCVEGSKRREVLTAKDEKPVNLWNLQNPLPLFRAQSRGSTPQRLPLSNLSYKKLVTCDRENLPVTSHQFFNRYFSTSPKNKIPSVEISIISSEGISFGYFTNQLLGFTANNKCYFSAFTVRTLSTVGLPSLS